MAENSNDNISPKGCIDYANQLLELCQLPFPRITSIQDINSNFLVSLVECITGLTIPDLLVSDDSTTEIHNIQAVIDTLSLDLLDTSLSHITGESIVGGDIFSILNLFEVLEAFFLYSGSQNNKSMKKSPGTSAAEDNSTTVASTTKLNRNTTSIKYLTSSSDENIPPTRILKRKTCRSTLRKPHQNPLISEKKLSDASPTDLAGPSHSNRHTDIDGFKSPLKRKNLKPSSRPVKRPHTEGIEELYDLNFEKKIRALLYCDKSPTLRAQLMKKNYIQSLKTPLKKAPVSPCRKSFLLPHNLRHRNRSTVRQSPTRKKTSQRKKNVKHPISENTDISEKEDDIPAIIQSTLEEFPGFKFPKNTLSLLTKHYYQHVGLMHKQLRETLLKKPKKLIQTEKAMEDEAKLSKILVKDLKEKKFLREQNEHKIVENRIKSSFRDARLQSAKIRQYFDEYHKTMSKKMQKRNFTEEVLIEKTFKEILNLQKEKVRLLCQRVRETDEQDSKTHKQYLSALKNLYKEQLSMLAESINDEHKDSLERAKAQKWSVEKMNQEFRKKLQKEVQCLQKDVLEMIEDIHFQELDAQNFISSFQQQGS